MPYNGTTWPVHGLGQGHHFQAPREGTAKGERWDIIVYRVDKGIIDKGLAHKLGVLIIGEYVIVYKGFLFGLAEADKEIVFEKSLGVVCFNKLYAVSILVVVVSDGVQIGEEVVS